MFWFKLLINKVGELSFPKESTTGNNIERRRNGSLTELVHKTVSDAHTEWNQRNNVCQNITDQGVGLKIKVATGRENGNGL